MAVAHTCTCMCVEVSSSVREIPVNAVMRDDVACEHTSRVLIKTCVYPNDNVEDRRTDKHTHARARACTHTHKSTRKHQCVID